MSWLWCTCAEGVNPAWGSARTDIPIYPPRTSKFCLHCNSCGYSKFSLIILMHYKNVSTLWLCTCLLPARVSKVLASACGRACAVSRHKERSESPSCAFASNSYNVNSTTDSSEKKVTDWFCLERSLKSKAKRTVTSLQVNNETESSRIS